MHDFWYDYVRPKYGKKMLRYMDTDSFIVYIKTNDHYRGVAKDVETRFDNSNYKLHRPLPKKSKKVIGLMKDGLGGKIMKKFVEFRAKAYNYLIHDGSEDKKAKGTKMCV